MTQTQPMREQSPRERLRARIERMGERIAKLGAQLELDAKLGEEELRAALARARPTIREMTTDLDAIIEEAEGELDDRIDEVRRSIQDVERRYFGF